jgi:hypothetical protein
MTPAPEEEAAEVPGAPVGVGAAAEVAVAEAPAAVVQREAVAVVAPASAKGSSAGVQASPLAGALQRSPRPCPARA